MESEKKPGLADKRSKSSSGGLSGKHGEGCQCDTRNDERNVGQYVEKDMRRTGDQKDLCLVLKVRQR